VGSFRVILQFESHGRRRSIWQSAPVQQLASIVASLGENTLGTHPKQSLFASKVERDEKCDYRSGYLAPDQISNFRRRDRELRLEEAERVGYGFDLPKAVVAPNAPKISSRKSETENAA